MKSNWSFAYKILLILLPVMVLVYLVQWMMPGTGSDVVSAPFYWTAPDATAIPETEAGELVAYGRALITETAHYLGPNGTVARISNGMNCQNCHLQAGTRFHGNNYGAASATYPRFRARSASIETLPKRINDCMERSLNGSALDTQSREMKAIEAYLKFIGSKVPAGVTPAGTGITQLPYLNRAADPVRGASIYRVHCQSCHGANGEGLSVDGGNTYLYPPLWGDNSFNTAAGLFRISRLAGFVKENMPFGIHYDQPTLTDENAWDVAAYVISQPRPSKQFPGDWPDPAAKPVDHPFGPFTDSFGTAQHQFGPFDPILKYRRENAVQTHQKK